MHQLQPACNDVCTCSWQPYTHTHTHRQSSRSTVSSTFPRCSRTLHYFVPLYLLFQLGRYLSTQPKCHPSPSINLSLTRPPRVIWSVLCTCIALWIDFSHSAYYLVFIIYLFILLSSSSDINISRQRPWCLKHLCAPRVVACLGSNRLKRGRILLWSLAIPCPLLICPWVLTWSSYVLEVQAWVREPLRTLVLHSSCPKHMPCLGSSPSALQRAWPLLLPPLRVSRCGASQCCEIWPCCLEENQEE